MDFAEEIAGSKRPIGDHRDPALLRQRQNALLHFGFHQRIIDLEEIELLAAHQFFDFAQSSGLVMRDPDVANAALPFPFLQRGELCIHIDQIVHLDQVDSVRAQKRHGTLD